MNYSKLSEESLEEIMTKIRVENGIKHTRKDDNFSRVINQQTSIVNDETYEIFDKYINDAVIGKQIGLNKAPMKVKKGIALKLSRIIEKYYLRVSQLITRDIRDFNGSVLATFHEIKRKLLHIDENTILIKNNAVKLSEEVITLKNKLNQIEVDNQRVFNNFEYRINNEITKKINEYENKLKSYENEIKNYIQLFENRIKECENKTKLYENEIKNYIEAFESRMNNFESRLQSYESNNAINNEIDNKFNILEKINDEKFALLIDKYNQNQLSIRKLNEDIIKTKSIITWVNKAEFTETVKCKIGSETTFNPIFYHEFEEKFRGTRADIKERLMVYVPMIDNLFGEWTNRKFIDIGCGRGEWLDILKDKGVVDYIGVDLNEIQINICNEFGHKAIKNDCLEYINELPDECIDMITGFQIIEHLPLEELFTLLNECHRVLRKGGIILFETPNPSNLLTGATYFYADPTHNRPLYKESVRFFAEHSGFSNVEIIEVNPVRYSNTLISPTCFDGNQVIWNENIEILNNLLFGSQDYAVMGVK